MEIGSEQAITWGTILVGMLANWFATKYRVDRLEEKDIEQARQIEALWKWKDAHEKESVGWRERFSREFSTLNGSNLVNNEQLKRISEMFVEIKDRLEKLESRRGE